MFFYWYGISDDYSPETSNIITGITVTNKKLKSNPSQEYNSKTKPKDKTDAIIKSYYSTNNMQVVFKLEKKTTKEIKEDIAKIPIGIKNLRSMIQNEVSEKDYGFIHNSDENELNIEIIMNQDAQNELIIQENILKTVGDSKNQIATMKIPAIFLQLN